MKRRHIKLTTTTTTTRRRRKYVPPILFCDATPSSIGFYDHRAKHGYHLHLPHKLKQHQSEALAVTISAMYWKPNVIINDHQGNVSLWRKYPHIPYNHELLSLINLSYQHHPHLQIKWCRSSMNYADVMSRDPYNHNIVSLPTSLHNHVYHFHNNNKQHKRRHGKSEKRKEKNTKQ